MIQLKKNWIVKDKDSDPDWDENYVDKVLSDLNSYFKDIGYYCVITVELVERPNNSNYAN